MVAPPPPATPPPASFGAGPTTNEAMLHVLLLAAAVGVPHAPIPVLQKRGRASCTPPSPSSRKPAT
eukprot:700774-Prorocentrum_minimum.AAC.1